MLNDIFGAFLLFRNVIRQYVPAEEELKDSVIKLLIKHVVFSYFAEKWDSTGRKNPEIYRNLKSFITALFNEDYLLINDKISLMHLAFYLCRYNQFGQEKYPDCRHEIEKIIGEIMKENTMNQFVKRIFKTNDPKDGVQQRRITIADVDLMSGSEFEVLVADMFSRMHYMTRVTKTSGDQGIDVIAERDEVVIGIQTKCYSSSVGNYAIQEAVAGGKFYRCNKIIVVTNRNFTQSAIQLAKANEVVLWDREILTSKLFELY